MRREYRFAMAWASTLVLALPCSAKEEADAQANPVIYKYVGNAFSLKFHRPSCPFAKAMWRSNRVHFTYRRQALEAHQKPCRYCLPPSWKSVAAAILEKQEQTKRIEEELPPPDAGSLEYAKRSVCEFSSHEPDKRDSIDRGSQADSDNEKAPVLSRAEMTPVRPPKKDVKSALSNDYRGD